MPTTKKPAGEAAKPARRAVKGAAEASEPVAGTERPATRRVRKTEIEAAAANPEPTPVAAAVPTRDRTLTVAVAFVAAVALFAVGFGIGRASGDSGTVFGANQQDGRPGQGPFVDRGRPDMRIPRVPGPRGGGGFIPGPGPVPEPLPGNGDQGTPPELSGQAFLGIAGFDAPPGGVKVTEVQPGSGAEAAGLLVGDRIVSVDDMEIASMDQLAGLIGSSSPGRTITIGVDRLGESLTLTATLGARAD